MVIVFVRKEGKLYVYDEENQSIGTFEAANNAATSSKGEWPKGVHEGGKLIAVGGADGEPSGAYGKWFVKFPDFEDVDGEVRTGMGIHAGRWGMTDKAGRAGVRYATMGCIRTTAPAMEAIARADAGERMLLAVFD